MIIFVECVCVKKLFITSLWNLLLSDHIHIMTHFVYGIIADNMPVPKSMLTLHQWSSAAFTWVQMHKQMLNTDDKCIWILQT